MSQAQSYNYIYLIFIAFIVANTVLTIMKKNKIGKKLMEIERSWGMTKYIGVAVITLAVFYMFRLTFLEYKVASGQSIDKSKTIFNLVAQLIFWISFYVYMMYSQLSKKFIGEYGLAIGSRVITWEQIEKYSWSKNNLIITINEKVLTKVSKKDIYLIIPVEKIQPVREILIKKVVRKIK